MIEQLNDGRHSNSGGGFFGLPYVLNCLVSFIRNDDKVYYLACPEINCRKKVIEEDPGLRYRCESCNKHYDHCVPTYMLCAKISD
jgi:hypothetical protein